MMKRLLFSFALLIASLGSGYAQVLDPTYQLRELRNPVGPWALSLDKLQLVRQPDGRIIVGGSFDFVNGTRVQRLVRLLPNGALDPSFDVGAGANGLISALLLQPDGKLLVAGRMTAFDHVATASIIRLLPNGHLDTTFVAPRTTATNYMARQPDGKIIVVKGSINSSQSLVRLQPDGRADSTFVSYFNGSSLGYNIRTVLVQADGKIVLGGQGLSGQQNGITRLLPTGAFDPTFTPPYLSSMGVTCLMEQPDGKLLAGGNFTYQLTPRTRVQGLLRLLPTGQPDTTFAPPATTVTLIPSILKLEPSGHVVVGGFRHPGTAAGYAGFLTRFGPTGTPDTTFAAGGGPDSPPNSIASDGAGGYLLSGFVHRFSGQPCYGLVHLLPGGVPDPAFRPVLESRGFVSGCQLQPGGEALVHGLFGTVDGLPRPVSNGYLWRMTANGVLDTTFRCDEPGFLRNTEASGAFLISRQATATAPAKLIRCFPNGAPDTSFHNPAWTISNILGTLTLANGDLIVYGVRSRTLPSAPGIYRLPAGGGTVPTYAVGGRTWAVLRQPDDNLIVLDDSLRFSRRFAASGRLDSSFQVRFWPRYSSIPSQTMLMQPTTGQVVLGGQFMDYQWQPLPQSLLRLTTTGAIDTTFRTRGNYWLRAMQPDGKLLVTTFPDSANTTLRRLLPDGQEDPSFVPVAIPQGYADGYLEGIALYPNGDLLLYGSFASVAGQPRMGLARLTLNPTGLPEPASASALTLYPNPAHHRVTLTTAPSPEAQPVQVLDALGRTVLMTHLEPQTSHLELPLVGLPAGVYVVRVGAAARRLVVE